jgi:uncharacterized protein (TIGR00369 family)
MPTFHASNPDYARDLERIVSNMPIVQFLSLRLVHIAPGDVRLAMPYRDEMAFVPGSLQAGPIGTLLDLAAGWCLMTLLPAGWGNATVDFGVKMLAPAVGASFEAHAVALSSGKTLSVAEVKVFAVDAGVQTQCAAGMATMRNFRFAAA